MNRARFATVLAAVAAGALLTACSEAGTTDGTPTPEMQSATAEYAVTELPFQLDSTATGVAIDSAGNVYVADVGAGNEVVRGGYTLGSSTGRILVLRNGTSTQEEFAKDLTAPYGLAIGPDGTLYVADKVDDQVLGLTGTSSPVILPYPADFDPVRIAVNDNGDVYTLAGDDVHVLRSGSTTPSIIESFFSSGDAIAVNPAGDVYFTDTFDDVYVSTQGTAEAEEFAPLYDDCSPVAMAFGQDGALYFVDESTETTTSPDGLVTTTTTSFHVRKLDAGATEPTELPITGLTNPTAMTVDTGGALYITDNQRVLKIEKS